MNRLLSALLHVTITLLVLTALYAGIGRQLMPMVREYRSDIERQLSQHLDMPVHIGLVEGSWERLTPVIRLQHIALQSRNEEGRTLLDIPAIEVRPRLLASLWHRKLRADISIHGLNLTLIEDDTGRFSVAELAREPETGPNTSDRFVRALLDLPGLALNSVRLDVIRAGKPRLQVKGQRIVLVNSRSEHRLHGHLLLQSHNDFPLDFHLRWNGDPMQPDLLQVEAYIRLANTELMPWMDYLPLTLKQKIRQWGELQQLHAGGEIWLAWQFGQLHSLQARLDASHIQLLTPEQTLHQIQNLHSHFQWTKMKEGVWRLQADDTRFTLDNTHWPATRFQIQMQDSAAPDGTSDNTSDDTHSLEIHADRLALTQLTHLALLAPALTGVSKDWLQEARPNGELQALSLLLTRHAEAPWQLHQANARLQDLSISPWKQLPGVNHLNAVLEASATSGTLALSGHDMTYVDPARFRWPLALDHLQGGLIWQKQDNGWLLQSSPITLGNQDAQAAALLTVRLPDTQPHTLSLVAGISHGSARSKSLYLPAKSMPASLVQWLDQSITAGTLSLGGFLYEGPLTANPPEQTPNHRFQMRYAVDDATLAYQPEWPALQQLSADVLIDNNHMFVQHGRARLQKTQLSNINASIISNAKAAAPQLDIRADVASSMPDIIHLLTHTPLKDNAGSWLKNGSGQGLVNGQLQLQIPLDGHSEVQVDARAQMKNVQLDLHNNDLHFSHVNGAFRYASASLFADTRLSAQLFAHPVEISGEPAGALRLNGRIDMPVLARWSAEPLLSRASGQMPYLATLSLSPSSPPSSPLLSIRSTLEGVQINLPEPLGKTAKEKVDLQYETRPGDDSAPVRLSYGKRASLLAMNQRGQLLRGALRIGPGEPALPAEGWSLTANVRELDLSSWMATLAQIKTTTSSKSTSGARGSDAFSWRSITLNSGQLRAGALLLHQASVQAEHQADDWSVKLDSSRLHGTVLWRNASQALNRQSLSLAIERLQLPLSDETHSDNNSGTSERAATTLDAALLMRLPALQVHIAQLQTDTGLSGELQLNAQVNSSGSATSGNTASGTQQTTNTSGPALEISRLDFVHPAFEWHGRARWQTGNNDHNSSNERTHIDGTLHIVDAGQFMETFDHPAVLSKGSGDLNLELAWPGAPWAIATGKMPFEQLQGAYDMQLGAGRVLTVNRATSATRVLGLFNFDTLRRRMKLDFSDITGKGLPFDQIHSEGRIQAGILHIDQFALTGPSIRTTSSGTVDLRNRRLDQSMTVNLPVGGSLSVAATVLGGPLLGGATAGAAVAADKFLGERLKKFTTLHYHLGGTLDEPDIGLVRRRKWFGKNATDDDDKTPDANVSGPKENISEDLSPP